MSSWSGANLASKGSSGVTEVVPEKTTRIERKGPGSMFLIHSSSQSPFYLYCTPLFVGSSTFNPHFSLVAFTFMAEETVSERDIGQFGQTALQTSPWPDETDV